MFLEQKAKLWCGVAGGGGELLALPYVLVCQHYCNKVPQTGWFKQQTFNVSVLEARSFISRCWQCLFFLRAMRERSVPGLSPWLVDGHLHVHMAFSLYVYLCVQISSFYKDISHIELRPAYLNELTLTWIPLQGSYLHTRSHSEELGVRTSTYGFGWRTVQPVIPYLLTWFHVHFMIT